MPCTRAALGPSAATPVRAASKPNRVQSAPPPGAEATGRAEEDPQPARAAAASNTSITNRGDRCKVRDTLANQGHPEGVMRRRRRSASIRSMSATADARDGAVEAAPGSTRADAGMQMARWSAKAWLIAAGVFLVGGAVWYARSATVPLIV